MLARLKKTLRTPGAAKLMLVACALIWGSSMFMMKDATESLPVFWLLMLRFGIAAVLTMTAFWKQVRAHLDRRTVGVGLWLGVLEWGGYAVQTVGLTMTTPGKASFITGSYCVMVPFIAWVLGMGKPHRYDLVAAVMCSGGLALVALDQGLPINPGDLLTVFCALLYALQLVEVSRRGAELDVWALTAWQFVFMTVASGAIALFEPVPAANVWTPELFGSLAYFGVMCSFVCLTLMNYAFTRVPPAEGSLLASLESPFGVFFSVLAGREVLNGRVVSGFVLIFMAVLVSNGWVWLRDKVRAARAAREAE